MNMSFFGLDEFDDIKKIMKKMLDANMEQFEDDGDKIRGGWNIKEIDKPGIKGYIIEGRFYSDQPMNDSESPEPLDPTPIRRPLPESPFGIPEKTAEPREPLTDVFEDKDAIKIYVELPGEDEDDIQLTITDGNVEIKGKSFHKKLEMPMNLDNEKASKKHNNGVLTVTIPKRQSSETDKQVKDGIYYSRKMTKPHNFDSDDYAGLLGKARSV